MSGLATNLGLNKPKKTGFMAAIRRHYMIYLLVAPALILTFIFAYIPLPGIIVAFQKYDIFKGVLHSPFIGLENFRQIFVYPQFNKAIWNTFYISVLSLLVSFPAPIILALLLNELKGRLFKRTVQTISYLPHFLSWISVVGIAYSMLSMYGPINDLRLAIFGKDTERLMFLSYQSWFIPVMLFLTVWKSIGWNSVVYLAAMSGIDQQMYEAAKIDGASHVQQIWHITLPSILPTIVILLIFSMGGLFRSNFELVYGLQNAFIDFEVISTVVYKTGIQGARYDLGTAIGFLEGLVAFILTWVANKAAKSTSGISIW